MSEKFETLSVRGIGFAPEKKQHLVLPPDVTTHQELEEWLKTQAIKGVGEAALESLE